MSKYIKENYQRLSTSNRSFILLDIAVLLVAALCPLYYASPSSLGVYEVLGALLLMGLFLAILFVRPFKMRVYDFTIIYALFTLQIIISCLAIKTSWVDSTRTMIILLIAMLVPVSEKMAKLALPLCTASGFLTALYLIINGETIGGRTTIKFGGFYEDPNWIALLFVVPFIYSLHKLSEKGFMKTIVKILYVLILSVSAVATIMTASRGAVVGMIFGVVLWLVMDKKVSVKRIIVVIISTAIFFILLDTIFSGFITENVIKRLTNFSGGSGRIDIWSDLFREFPKGSFFQILFGRGYGVTETVIGMGAHNDLFESLFELGIFGAILNVLFWLYLLRYLKRAQNHIGFTVVAVFFVESMFSPIQTIVYFLMPITGIICSSKPVEEQGIKGYKFTLTI